MLKTNKLTKTVVIRCLWWLWNFNSLKPRVTNMFVIRFKPPLSGINHSNAHTCPLKHWKSNMCSGWFSLLSICERMFFFFIPICGFAVQYMFWLCERSYCQHQCCKCAFCFVSLGLEDVFSASLLELLLNRPTDRHLPDYCELVAMPIHIPTIFGEKASGKVNET